MARSRVVRAFSAGGVVVRPIGEAEVMDARMARAATGASPPSVEIALVGYPREDVWVLPKGTPSEGESPEQTALREVREETGLEVRILRELGSIEYWFARKSVRFHKEVAHFLMEAIGGDVARHDHEYEEARWFSFNEAIRKLTHTNEALVVRRAEPAIQLWLPTTKPGAPPDGSV